MPTKVKLRIPEGWHEFTVGQYVNTVRIMREPVDEKDLLYKIRRQYRLVAAVLGVEVDTISHLNRGQLEDILELTSWRSVMPQGKLVRKWEHKGHRYTLPLDLTDMDFGQYLDIVGTTSQDDDDVHRVLAILMRRGYERRRWFKWRKAERRTDQHADFIAAHMPMSVAYPFFLFFVQVSEGLSRQTVGSLLKETTKQIQALLAQSRVNSSNGIGDGSPA